MIDSLLTKAMKLMPHRNGAISSKGVSMLRKLG